jgi:hypothetical protein
MSGVSGPSSPKPAAKMEQVAVLQLSEQLHVQVPPDACAIEIESTPSAGGEMTHMGRLLSLAPPVGLGLK